MMLPATVCFFECCKGAGGCNLTGGSNLSYWVAKFAEQRACRGETAVSCHFVRLFDKSC